MIDLGFYKVLHEASSLALFLSLGALFPSAWKADCPAPIRRLAIITHGIGILLLLISGFGMLARLGLSWPLPGWVIPKLVAWLVLAAAPAIYKRMPNRVALVWCGLIVLGLLASYFGHIKPF